jgi:DNA-damage-inducible protein D
MTFDEIKHTDETGAEYWTARELQTVLQYKEWRNFQKVIDTAKIACKISRQEVPYHFVDLNKMIDLPKGAAREVQDNRLTRYAGYLIVMNGDPRKEVIAQRRKRAFPNWKRKPEKNYNRFVRG